MKSSVLNVKLDLATALKNRLARNKFNTLKIMTMTMKVIYMVTKIT